MTELLPCPFCGGEASKRLFYGARYGVYCDECDACVGGLFNTEAEAISAWNARATLGGVECENANKDGYSFHFECSKCGHSVIVHDCHVRLDELPSYCPNCGAKVTN